MKRALLLLTICNCSAFDRLDNRDQQRPEDDLPPLDLKVAASADTCMPIGFVRCPERVAVRDFEIDCIGTAEKVMAECNAQSNDVDGCSMQTDILVDLCISSRARARGTRSTSSHCLQRTYNARHQCMFQSSDTRRCTKQMQVLWSACEQQELRR